VKARKDETVTVAVFCAFLAVMSALFLLLPKKDFSETEKRYLEETPALTWQRVASGEFGQDAETYMADHMPGRDFFVGLQAYYELYTGRQAAKDIYLADGQRLVEAPADHNKAAIAKNLTAINAFADMLQIPVDLMIVPSAGWAHRQDIRGLAYEYRDEAILADIYSGAGSNVRCLDLTDIFAQPQDLYYRTDHHWTSLGAYKAYAAYMQYLGREYRDQTDFTVETVDGFRGSTHSRAALWMIPGESLELWTGSTGITVTNGESQEVHSGIFYRNRLGELDKYTVYLDGNHSIVRLENPDAKTSGKLLVIRDSYSNCLGGFLAESYETVVLVDLRYFKQTPVSLLCQEENFDNVLICYSVGNFMTDENLVWLR